MNESGGISGTGSVARLGHALRTGAVTAVELAERSLARIAERDAELHAVLTVTAERAEADARRADAELARGLDRGPLHGVPYGLKDIIATRGIRTTCNSRTELDTVPDQDAEVARRLRAAGGVLVGKLNTAEFALGGGDDLPWPAARNPWNPEHFTGTSSTGSGAAVAAGMVPVAVGSDTGGSIRSPAALCGVVGLKPTYGRVSRRGLYPLSWSLDHAGPLAGSVEDAAVAFGVLAGHDPADPASVDVPVADPVGTLEDGVEGIRVGYVRHWLTGPGGASEAVLAATDAVAGRLAGRGALVEDVTLPDFEVYKACGRVIMVCEALTVHGDRLRDRPRDYGRYSYQRIVPAAGLGSADLLAAQRARRELTAATAAVLRRYDVLLTATAPEPASPMSVFGPDWPPPGRAVAVYTAPFNVTGHPALSLPSGLSPDGLPLGVQLCGGAFDEATVLRVARAVERDVAVGPAPDRR